MRIKKDTNKDRWPEETGAFAAPGNVSDRVKNVPANLEMLVATQKDESQMNSVPFTRKALQCWGEGTSTQHTLNLDGRVHIVAIKMQVVKRTINAFIFNHVSVYVCTPECRCWRKPEEGNQIPWSYRALMSGNQTQVLLRSSMCSKPLSHLSTPSPPPVDFKMIL